MQCNRFIIPFYFLVRLVMSKGYLSELTVFMNKYLEDNPEVVKAQQVGRSTLWKDTHAAIKPVVQQEKDASKKN